MDNTTKPAKKRSYRKKSYEWNGEVCNDRELQNPYFPVDKLPNELKIRILSFLDIFDLIKRTCRVSTAWRTLSYDKTLWESIDLSIFSSHTQKEDWEKIAATASWQQKLRNVKIVEVPRSFKPADVGLRTFLPFMINLEVLNVNECGMLSNETLELVGVHCKKLKILLAGSWVDGGALGFYTHMGHLGNAPIRTLVRCEMLETVDINGWGITDYGLALLARSCKNLKNLNVATCPNLTPAGFKSLADFSVSLEVLDASDILTDDGMTALANMQSLQILVAVDSYITTESVIYLLNKSKSLHQVLIGGCKFLDKERIFEETRTSSVVSFDKEDTYSLDWKVWGY